MSRLLRMSFTALGTAAVLAGTAVPASAGITPAPIPIGPNQLFAGLVNGQEGNATIQMGCFGPVGGTGHPLAGQTVSVRPASTSGTADVGFTGSAATQIAVTFGTSSSTDKPIVLDAYGVTAEIPTTLTLPCGGPGVVVFTPLPTSSTARADTVDVEFSGQP